MQLLASEQLIHCVDRFRHKAILPTPKHACRTRKRLKNENGLTGDLSNRYPRSEQPPNSSTLLLAVSDPTASASSALL